MGVLPPVAAGRYRARALDASASAADRTIVIRPTRSTAHRSGRGDDVRVGDAVFVIRRRNLTIPGAR